MSLLLRISDKGIIATAVCISCTTVVALSEEEPTLVAASFSCTLKFVVKDCDPTTGEADDDEGYEDEYVLEDLDLSVADHEHKV